MITKEENVEKVYFLNNGLAEEHYLRYGISHIGHFYNISGICVDPVNPISHACLRSKGCTFYTIPKEMIITMMEANAKFKEGCYKYSLNPTIQFLAHMYQDDSETLGKIYKGLKYNHVLNIAKKSRFLDLKEGQHSPFPYGGFLFNGKLTQIFSNGGEQLATMVYDQPGFIFPTKDPLEVKGEVNTCVLAFSSLNGIGVMDANNYLGYLLKNVKTTEHGISNLHHAINN